MPPHRVPFAAGVVLPALARPDTRTSTAPPNHALKQLPSPQHIASSIARYSNSIGTSSNGTRPVLPQDLKLPFPAPVAQGISYINGGTAIRNSSATSDTRLRVPETVELLDDIVEEDDDDDLAGADKSGSTKTANRSSSLSADEITETDLNNLPETSVTTAAASDTTNKEQQQRPVVVSVQDDSQGSMLNVSSSFEVDESQFARDEEEFSKLLTAEASALPEHPASSSASTSPPPAQRSKRAPPSSSSSTSSSPPRRQPVGPYVYTSYTPITTPLADDDLASEYRKINHDPSELERYYGDMTFSEWAKAGDELVERAAGLIRRAVEIRKVKAEALAVLEKKIDEHARMLEERAEGIATEREKIRVRAVQLIDNQ
ncbi:hypothetical protein BZA70DRAFT_295447 [Myxozyma melibiosi]|uniref:Extracellular mutant protein 11 C-terminal domain-containing protein n=1 Tax=Myxozyma melibiosi TaxID=54550 RepID=A0ABR1F540_9ASCO